LVSWRVLFANPKEWLNRIQTLADSGKLGTADLRNLLESWRLVISLAREIYEMQRVA